MTWREFEYRARGYFLRLARQKWMFRELIWHMRIVNGDSEVERKEIMVLPWDEPDIIKPERTYTPQQLEEINERFTKFQQQLTKDNNQ